MFRLLNAIVLNIYGEVLNCQSDLKEIHSYFFFLWISHPKVISSGSKEVREFTNAINVQINPVQKVSKRMDQFKKYPKEWIKNLHNIYKQTMHC